MNKKIIITNGTGTSGKDTFAKILAKYTSVTKYSSIDIIKDIAELGGVDRNIKNEKTRKLWSDLKDLFAAHNGLPFNDIKSIVKDFQLGELDSDILTIDIREPNEIERAKKEFDAITVLIKNDNVEQITSNHADANVFNYTYDYVLDNSGTLDDLEKGIVVFLDWLVKNDDGRVVDDTFENIVYIAHPFSGKQENIDKVSEIIKELKKKHPTYLFICPIHTFQSLYNEVPYEEGMKYCYWLLEKCDEMWVCGDWQNSKGCQLEVDYCKKYGIRYEIKA